MEIKIKPHSRICKSKKLFAEKEYKVLQVSNCMGESPVDLSFRIENELGEEIWVEDWDCVENPRIDRIAFMKGRFEVDKMYYK